MKNVTYFLENDALQINVTEMKEQEEELGTLEDIEIENTAPSDYMTNLDKVNTMEDISFYFLFFVFLIINLAIGYFAPPHKQSLTRQALIYDTGSNCSVYSITVNGLQFRNSWIKIYVKYIRDGYFLEQDSMVANIKTTISYNNPRSDHSMHAFQSTAALFHVKENETTTNLKQVYSENIVDFDGITAEIVVESSNEAMFTEFHMTAEYGTFSDCVLQVWIRLLYTVLVIVIMYYFNERIKNSQIRYEQQLTKGVLVATICYNDALLLINYVLPGHVLRFLDEIMKTLYCGYLMMLVLVLVSQLGAKKAYTLSFKSQQALIAAVFTITLLARNFMNNYRDLLNLGDRIEYLSDSFVSIVRVVLLMYIALVVFELYEAFKRIDSAEMFRFNIYSLIAIASIFIISATQGLMGEYDSILFTTIMGSVNVLAILMAYTSFPLTVKETVAYQEAEEDNKPIEDFENGLLDNSDNPEDDKNENKEEEDVIYVEEEECEEE